jgi:tRNA(Ile)-lysidine synthase
MEELGPLPAGARLLIALSGGSDSVALLSLAHSWRETRRPDIGIAAGHLDHGLRGDESRADAEFCRALAGRFGIEIIEDTEDVAARARHARISIETAGREARLEAFARWARRTGGVAVLTAHHQDDQVETVLAHLLRGAGPGGLSGMRARRPLAGAHDAELWRPCLAFARAELAEHRRSALLPHRDDAMNRDLSTTRNRIRHRILPALRADGDVDGLLIRLAAGARGVAAARCAALGPLIERVRVVPPHAAVPPEVIDAVGEDAGLSGALFAEVWRRSQGRPGALTRAHFAIWRRFAAGHGDGRSCDLPRGAALERAGGWLFLIGARGEAAPPPQPLPQEGTLRWRGVRIEVGGDVPDGALSAALPEGTPLELRGARPGDRIRCGASRHRVAEWLRVAGVPARWRACYPVVCCGEEIVWVPGTRRPAAAGNRRVHIIIEDEREPIAFLLALIAARAASAR